MQPDLNRLRIFYFVHRNKSIVAAAEALHLTPSAVSQHLQKLERELKTPLFTRLHKRLVSTAAAENLIGIVGPFIDQLDAGIRGIAHAKDIPAGHLRIGAPKEFGKTYFPGIFGAFRKRYPEVSFALTLGNPSTLLTGVGDGALDFAFVDMFPIRGQMATAPAFLSIEPIIEEEVILACSRDYYLQRVGRPHTAKRLSAMDFITYRPEAAALRNWFKHHFGKTAVHLNMVLIVDNHQAVIGAIKADMGLGVVSSHLVWEDIQSGAMIAVSTRKNEVINRIALVQLSDKVPTLTERLFHAHLRESLRETGMPTPAFRVIGQ